jgi:hypothetical protein
MYYKRTNSNNKPMVQKKFHWDNPSDITFMTMFLTIVPLTSEVPLVEKIQVRAAGM